MAEVPHSTRLVLSAAVTDALRAQLPTVAERTVQAVIADVPSYADAFSGEMGRTIENAVRLALGTFLDIVSRAHGGDLDSAREPALSGAYELGRGEARSGRTMDALAAAYRVGARTAWQEFAGTAASGGVPSEAMGEFAGLVFAYIDELSAASVSGHTDELALSGRVRQRYLDRLAQGLIAGSPADSLLAAAERAAWTPPKTLTAVLLPVTNTRGLMADLDPATLQPTESVSGLESGDDIAVLLVPDAGGRSRRTLMRRLDGRHAVVGPARPWTQVQASYARALRTHELGVGAGPAPVDTDVHLTELVLGADPDALADLRAKVLAPLAELRPSAAEKLTETLRCWLLHHGRREEIAAALFVHAQTVRYRMGQLREAYGDQLDDPTFVLEATIALGLASPTAPA
jgi:hypothetical protein